MWTETYHRFADEAAFLATCDAAGWTRGPGGKASPPADHQVWTHPRIIMTPHNAAFDTKRERSRYVAHAILAHERGEPLPNLFQPARGY